MKKPKNNFPPLRPADVIIVHGTARFSRCIAFFERFIPNAWSKRIVGKPFVATHVASTFGKFVLIEAVNRIRLAPLREYDKSRVEIYRFDKLQPHYAFGITEALAREWNEPYGWFQIFLFVLDAICGVRWFSRKFGKLKFKVCSQFYAYGWQVGTGLQLIHGEQWQEIDPQDMRDYFRGCPEWKLIYATPEVVR